MAIQWIVFDAVGTLIFPRPDVSTAYHRVGQRYGSQLSRKVVGQRFRAAFNRQSQRSRDANHHTDEAGEEIFWRRVVSEVFDDVIDQERCFGDLFEHFGRSDSWACFPDVAPTLELLTKRGYRLAIGSNFDGRLHALCDGLSPLKSIDCRVISSEVGFRKPSLQFFESLVGQTGAPPDSLLFVGDDELNDVIGSRQAGLRVLYLNRAGGPQPLKLPLLSRPWIRSLAELEGLQS